MRELALFTPACPAWIDLGRWLWSPGFQGAGRPVAVALVVGLAVLAAGCLIWRAGSGPATHAERRATRSLWRWAHTVLALAFPPLLAAGAWLIVLPAPKPMKLVLISRALRPELFDEAKWANAAAATAAPSDSASTAPDPLDAGPIVDDVLRRLGELPKLPTRDELASNGPEVDKVREILVQAVLERQKLNDLRLPAGQNVASLQPSKEVHAIPAWLVESVELGCLRLLVERTNVRGVLIGTAGRVDRFGQQTYVDAPGYLAGRGSLDKEAVRAEVASKSETAITLISASPWPGGKLLLLFRVPPTAAGATGTGAAGLTAKLKDESRTSLADQSFKSESRVQLISKIISAPADTVAVEAKAPDGTLTQAAVPGPRAPVSVLVGPGTVPSPPGDASDRSYLYRVMDDLKTRGPVSFVTSASGGRVVRFDPDPSGAGVWLYFEGADFDRTLKAKGTDPKVRKLELQEVSAPSMLSLDRHQIVSGVEPAMPKAGGFVLGWMPAYLTPRPTTGVLPTTPLQLGEVKQGPASIPLVAALPDKKNPRESVIWFGASPPVSGDTSVGSAAYWWTVGRLAQRCAYPANLTAADWKATAPSAELRPITLLDDRHIARVSSMAHAIGSTLLGVALLLTSIATLMNLGRARRKHRPLGP